VLQPFQRKQAIIECLRFLSQLVRKILRSFKKINNKEIDLQIVTADIDISMWGDAAPSGNFYEDTFS